MNPAYPPLLTTRDAAHYLRFRSTSGIRTAVMRGELKPCGVGPKASHMFTVEELDRFVQARAARYARRGIDHPALAVVAAVGNDNHPIHPRKPLQQTAG